MTGNNRVKKFIRRLSIAVFLVILIMPSAAWGMCRLAGVKEPAIMEALDFDLGENRERASFPKEVRLSGITSELEAYYNDHVPFRSVIITINRRINSKFERAYSSKIQPVLVALMYTKRTASNTAVNGSASLSPGMEPSGENGKGGENVMDKQPQGDGTDNAEIIQDGGLAWGNMESDSSDTDSNHNGNGSGDGNGGGNSNENGNGNGNVSCNESSNENEDNKGSNNSGENDSSNITGGGKGNEGNLDDENRDEFSENTNVPYLPPREMNGTIFGREDWMFCNYDNSIAYYCGSNVMSEQQMEDKLSLMIKLKQICDIRGIQLQFMIAPNKEQVYSEYMPSYEIENTYKREQRFVDYVRKNSEVNIVYPLAELIAAKKHMSTYYKYDTHWNHYGSFIATRALYKDMGVELSDFDSIDFQESSCIWGLVITAGLSWQDYERDYDHIPQYKPEVQILETDGEIDIIHTERSAVYRVESTADRDCNFVMVGDSFRLYMVPYLERDFSHVTISHRDNIEDIQDDIKEADILVIECVERMDDGLNGTILQLIEILGEKSENKRMY